MSKESEQGDKDRVFSSWFLSGGPPSFSKRSTMIEKKNHIRTVIGENAAGDAGPVAKDRTKRKLPFTDDDTGNETSSTSKVKAASSASLASKEDEKPSLLQDNPTSTTSTSTANAASPLVSTSAITSPSFSNKTELQEEISSTATEEALINIIAKESEKRKSLDKMILDSL